MTKQGPQAAENQKYLKQEEKKNLSIIFLIVDKDPQTSWAHGHDKS